MKHKQWNTGKHNITSGEAKGPACPAGQDHKFPKITIFKILKIDSLYEIIICLIQRHFLCYSTLILRGCALFQF